MFCIGWIGSAATSSHVLLLKDCLLQLQELYNVKLVLIGFDTALENELQGLHYINHKWQQNTEISLLKTCDVGIMPLPEDSLALGNSGFGLIHYMACGLSTISTPTEVTIRINHGNDNLFAKNKFEWYSCFTAMIQNKEYHKEAGKKNTDVVGEYYSAKKNQQDYLALFTEIESNEL